MSAVPRDPVEPPHEPAVEPAAPVTPSTLEAVAQRVNAEYLAPSRKERSRGWLALVAFALVLAAHVARIGSMRARVVALVVVVLVWLVPLVLLLRERRLLRDPRAVLLRASRALGIAEVSRVLSGITLAERVARDPDHEGVSPSLARLHARRAIERLELVRLAPLGTRRGIFFRRVSLVVFLVAALFFALAPLRVVEGFDVAIATRGKAPFAISWLDDTLLVVHPPSYLHQEDYETSRFGVVVANRGASIVVRGKVRHEGRLLSLADDRHEVPFLDDGHGGVVAHWAVAGSGRLRVRARFGDVVIDSPESWDLATLEDASPAVELQGAPKTIQLEDAGPSIPLRYDAYDDHGLREIHLVIRIGTHEERRVLAKLDGEPKHERGGYALKTSEPLVKKSRVPIALRVEARDNDPITGPKWGKSAEIILVPPVIGAAEVARFEALGAQRDALVDFLAGFLETETKTAAEVSTNLAKWKHVEDGIDELLVSSYHGLRIPPRLALVFRGRVRKLREALEAEQKAPSAGTHQKTRELLEKLVLGVDDAMRALSVRDARAIAKTLSEVASDGADAAHDLTRLEQQTSAESGYDAGEKKADSQGRLDVDLKVLDGGGESMGKLGELGHDLGEIVANDLRRARRALASNPPDLRHAELALRDLAARLAEPVPSFGGGQNPNAPGAPQADGGGEESDGEQGAADEESALEELAKEHGGTIGEVEDLLRDAEDPSALDDLKQEAKDRAQELRDAVAKLPKNGGMRKTLEAAEASAREKAEAMSQALEALQMGDARERADSALKALEDAKDKAWIEPGAEEKLDDIEKEIQKQSDWVDDILKKLRKQATEKAGEQVKKVGPREKGLSDKAKELVEKTEEKTPLPDDVKKLLDEAQKKMDDASKKLEQGDADEGLKAQREAQKLLEKARDQVKGEEEQGGGSEDGKMMSPDEKLDIPKAEDHKGPAAFRKRVLEGLGGGASSTKLQEAIKRYAEGLVK